MIATSFIGAATLLLLADMVIRCLDRRVDVIAIAVNGALIVWGVSAFFGSLK